MEGGLGEWVIAEMGGVGGGSAEGIMVEEGGSGEGVIDEEGGFGEGVTVEEGGPCERVMEEESDKALGASASTRTSRLLRFALIQG